MKRRDMIVITSSGLPMLDGRELFEGDEVEVKLGTPDGARWFTLELVTIGGRWGLALPKQSLFGTRRAILAVGQLARFPYSGERRKPPALVCRRNQFSPIDEFSDRAPNDEEKPC